MHISYAFLWIVLVLELAQELRRTDQGTEAQNLAHHIYGVLCFLTQHWNMDSAGGNNPVASKDA